MGRTRKTIAIAPFLHRQCQWSGEFAAVRNLKLSLEDETTSVRRLHPTEADDSNTDLSVICRSIANELQKGYALRLSEIARLFSGKYADFAVHAAAELLVSCGTLRRLGPIIPFHTFYAATHTAIEPCVAKEGLRFEKLACGLRKMYESLEKHLHVHKSQPRGRTQKARKESAAVKNNVQLPRRSSDKPPLYPPSKLQDHKEVGKHGANGTYRLEHDLTGEDGRHRLCVFVKLKDASEEQEAAMGTRNNARGPWKFSMHPAFSALPAFSAGLSMKDFMKWLHTTANMKAQRKTGGGLSSQSLQGAPNCAPVTVGSQILIPPKVEVLLSETDSSMPVCTTTLSTPQGPGVSSVSSMSVPEPAVSTFMNKKKGKSLTRIDYEPGATKKSERTGLGHILKPTSAKLPDQETFQPIMPFLAEKNQTEKSISRPRKKFAAPVAFKVDNEQHLKLQSPKLPFKTAAADDQVGMVASVSNSSEIGSEQGSGVTSLPRSTTVTELSQTPEVFSGQPVDIMPNSLSRSGSASVWTDETPVSDSDGHVKWTEPQIVQRKQSSVTEEHILSQSKPVMSGERGGCVTPANSTSAVVSGDVKSREGTRVRPEFVEEKSDTAKSHQEVCVQAQEHVLLLSSAGVYARQKSPEHMQAGPLQTVSVKVECVPANRLLPSPGRLQMRSSSRQSANEPFSMVAGPITLGPMPQTRVLQQPCSTEVESGMITETGAGGEGRMEKHEARRSRRLGKTAVENRQGGGSGDLKSKAQHMSGDYEGQVRVKVAKSLCCPPKSILNHAGLVPDEVLKEKEATEVGTPREAVHSAETLSVQKSVVETTQAAPMILSAGKICKEEGRIVTNAESTPMRVYEKRRQEKRVMLRQPTIHVNRMQPGRAGIKQIFETLGSIVSRLLLADRNENTVCEKGKMMAAMYEVPGSCSRTPKVGPSGDGKLGNGKPAGTRKRADELDEPGQSSTGGARRCRIKRDVEMGETASEQLPQEMTSPAANEEVQQGLMGIGLGKARSDSGDRQTTSPNGDTTLKRKRDRPRKDST